MFLFVYVQNSRVWKVARASAVLSGRSLNRHGARGTTFWDALRASFGGWLGSRLMEICSLSPWLSCSAGERLWLWDFTADDETLFVGGMVVVVVVVMAVVMMVVVELWSRRGEDCLTDAVPPLISGTSADNSLSLLPLAASTTGSDLISVWPWGDMTTRTQQANHSWLWAATATWRGGEESRGKLRRGMKGERWRGSGGKSD